MRLKKGYNVEMGLSESHHVQMEKKLLQERINDSCRRFIKEPKKKVKHKRPLLS